MIAPHDLFTHQAAWRNGLVLAKHSSQPPSQDMDDRAYWQHEIEVFDRVFAALVPARVEAVDHIADAGKMVPEIIDALIEASNQIEYLHGKFQETGSGNAVIAKLAEIRRALQAK